jgi:molybdopterin molybdotransferase
MAQLSNDCFAFGGPLLAVDAAHALIRERLTCVVPREPVQLEDADGRVLAAPVTAPIDLPPFDNSAVDGYTVRFRDLGSEASTILPVHGRIAAGDRAPSAGAGEAVRIFTGAPMPPGFDTVFMQEDVTTAPDGVVLPSGLKPGANRRLAGEDLARGQQALPAGRRLAPQDLALLAALGIPEVEVWRPLSVALFSTGNELVAPGTLLRPGAIYDSNRILLRALLMRLGCRVTDFGILPDRRDAVSRAIAEASEGHDLIVTSGGVSTGEEDHVKASVEAAGSLTFWRMAIKPGRPVALGVVGGTPFIGLPGNPVAVFVTFTQVARALIARLQGEDFREPQRLPVEAAFPYRKKEGRREFVRVRLAHGTDGRLIAHKHPREGAGVVTSLTETDGLVVLDETTTRIEPGAVVGFLPYGVIV